MRVNIDGNRLRHSNRIGELDRAAPCQARSHNVLRHVSCCICCRSINFGCVLSRKGSSSVRASTAVCINDDLAASKPSVAFRATYSERPRRIEECLETISAQSLRNHVIEHLSPEVITDTINRDVRCMLPRKNNGIDSHWNPIDVADSHLSLAIGFQDAAIRDDKGARAFDQIRSQRPCQRH